MKGLLSIALAGTMTFSIAHFSSISQIKPSTSASQQTAVSISTLKSTGSISKVSNLSAKGIARKSTGNDGDIPPIKTKYTDIVYGSLNVDYQVMNIYLPNKSRGPFPVIVYVHGGGFRSNYGSYAVNSNIAKMAKDDGYALVSINYRGADQAKFPAAVNDCKAAVRYLRANAARYKLNPKKIAAWGESAGGNLVSMLGTTGNVMTLDGDNVENLNYSSSVQAVVDWYGPIEFLKTDEQFAAAGMTSAEGLTNSETSNASKYIGQLITSNIYLAQLTAPSFYIPAMRAKTAPSFFIEHGTADRNVPVQQSKDFAAKLKKALGSNKVKLTLLDGIGHNAVQFYQKSNIKKVLVFLDGVFMKKTMIE